MTGPGDGGLAPDAWFARWVGFPSELFPSCRPGLFVFPPLGWYGRQCALVFGWLPSSIDGETVGDIERLFDARLSAAAEAAKESSKKAKSMRRGRR